MSTFSSMSFSWRTLLLPTLLASMLVPFAAAKAEIETFTDRAEFMERFSSPGDYIEENFSSLDTAERSSTHTFEGYSGSSTSFTVSTPPITESLGENAIWKAPLVDDDHWIGTEANDQTITLEFASGVHAVGGYFFQTDIDANAVLESLYVSINGGDAFKLFDIVTEDRPFFGIWTTGTGIETLVFSISGGQSNSGHYVSMANLVVTNVPEPSTYTFLGASALAFLALRHRKQTAKKA
jgi:hypothetical protein